MDDAYEYSMPTDLSESRRNEYHRGRDRECARDGSGTCLYHAHHRYEQPPKNCGGQERYVRSRSATFLRPPLQATLNGANPFMERLRWVFLLAVIGLNFSSPADAACDPLQCEGMVAGFRLPPPTVCAALASWDPTPVPNCGICVCGGTEGEWWCDTTALPNPTPCVGIAPPIAAPAPGAPQVPGPLPPGPPHNCGGAGGGPNSSVASTGALVNSLANPKLACCMNGWRETISGPGTEKFDCVESVPVPADGFDAYYNVAIDAANVAFPNQLFLVNAANSPITGFYNDRGERCAYSTGPKSASAQLADIRTVMADPARVLPAGISQSCPFLVRTALEVRCPPNPSAAGGPPWTAVGPRCTAAGSFVIHFAIDDLSDPAIHKRGRFRGSTTIGAPTVPGAPIFIDLVESTTLSVQEVFQRRLGCPASAGWKFAGGLCARQ